MKLSFLPSISWQWKLYIACIAVFGYQFVGHYLVRYFMYPAWAVGEGDPELMMDGLQKDWILHESGRTEFWYLRGNRTTAASPGPAVLFAHGNGELIDNRAPLLTSYQEAGVSVFLCEFRSYGRSIGRPTEEALVADFARVLAFARSLPEVDQERIIIHGRSLGGAIAAALASFEHPRALILESTFVDASASLSSRASLMWPIMIPDSWKSKERLKDYPGATLILHGAKDPAVPLNAAHIFNKMITNSKLIIFENGGHRLLGTTGEEYWIPIREFLSELDCWQGNAN